MRMAFTSRPRITERGDPGDSPRHLFVSDLQNGEVSALENTRCVDLPIWSFDGSCVAYLAGPEPDPANRGGVQTCNPSAFDSYVIDPVPDQSDLLRTFWPEVAMLTVLSSGAVSLRPSFARRFPGFETDRLSVLVGTAALTALHSHIAMGWILPIATRCASDAPQSSSGLGGVGRVIAWIVYPFAAFVVMYSVRLLPRGLASALGPGTFSSDESSPEGDS